MVLTNITNAEKKRFKKLQDDGMLPSQALKKIETERRLGIIPEDKPTGFITKDNWWFYTALGAIGIGMLYIYIRSPSSASPTQIQTQTVSLPNDDIEDIEYEEYEIDIEDYW